MPLYLDSVLSGGFKGVYDSCKSRGKPKLYTIMELGMNVNDEACAHIYLLDFPAKISA